MLGSNESFNQSHYVWKNKSTFIQWPTVKYGFSFVNLVNTYMRIIKPEMYSTLVKENTTYLRMCFEFWNRFPYEFRSS